MPRLKPKDVIAAIVILGFFYLRTQGINGGIDAAMALIMGYYFVKRENGADNGT